ncbi:hypothetical protein DLREEDagrD3_17740 [Denitratisoma sp. agr-D3]
MHLSRLLPLLLPLSGLLSAPAAQGALADEIQVYTDEINEPGEVGLEVHTITFPRGRQTRDYPGEVVPGHSLFVTLEPSYGLTKTVDVGLYLPMARDSSNGDISLAGLKGRIKWLPLRGEDHGGWYLGGNLEVGRVARRFNAVRSNAELRLMSGWHDEDWLLGFNPVVNWELSDQAVGKPGYGYAAKGTRRVAEGLALGLEYYSDKGQIGRTLPWEEQDNKLFYVIDVDRKPWVFNFGIGKGLTHAADKTTVKAIFEIPF